MTESVQNKQAGNKATKDDKSSLKFKLLGFVIILFPIISVAAALLVSSIFIALAGINPMEAYIALLRGAFGSTYGISQTLLRFVPLQLCGLAFLVAFKTGFFNVGTDGQFYVGAFAGTMVGIYVTGLPTPIHILLIFVVAFCVGALWAAIAGYLKVTLGISEILNSIMLTYVAQLLVDYLIDGPLAEPGGVISQTASIADSAKLPVMIPGTTIHYGVLVAVILTIAVALLIKRTSLGYKMRFAGYNPSAARFAGLNNKMLMMTAVLLSGGLAGIGGSIDAIGSLYRLAPGFSGGYGFDAIGAAVLGKLTPLGLTISCLLFAVLRVGAGSMQRDLGVPFPLVKVIQGLIILFIIGGTFISRKIEFYTGRRY